MIKGLLFDLNGTVIDIFTSETDSQIYRTTANFLDYYGVKISPETLQEEYFSNMKRQKKESFEEFPEFDVVEVFSDIIRKYHTGNIPPPDPATAAIVFRAAGRYRLEPYSGVLAVLNQLKNKFKIAAISDGQKIWAIPELHSAGLDKFFEVTVVSSDYGFRKPDSRMFAAALEKMQFSPQEVILVGNDMYRDIYGAHRIGMKNIFFKSNQGEQSFFAAEADYIIYNFNELPYAIDFLCR